MHQAQTKSIIFSCFLASVLEIYDLAIFGFLSTAIHNNFLSFLDKQTALFATFVMFAIGFIFRPVGSIIFGYIGDKFGRKVALVLSISIMGTCSLVLFILPTYNSIGIVSCYILVLVRVIQGISVGGEFTGAIVFTMEHMKSNKGLAIGIMSAAGSCGMLLSNLVSSILQNPELPEYSWRFAFLFGFSLAIVSYYIRRNLYETAEFRQIKDKNIKIPLFEGIKSYKLESLAVTCIAAANGAAVYFGMFFLPKHLNMISQTQDYNFVTLIVSSILSITMPIFGYFSDKFNRSKYLIITCSLMSIGTIIIMSMMSVDDLSFVPKLIVIYSLLAALMIGGINIYAAEIFPVQIRMSCMSFFYSIGMGFIGGTVPIVATYIVNNFAQAELALGIYIGAICFIAAISILLVFNKRKFTNINKN